AGRPRRAARLPLLGRVALPHGPRAPRRRRVHGMTIAPAATAVGNVIGGEERPAASGATFEKLSPATGKVISIAARAERPLGVAGLIIAANTPIANVAWKVFPALLCGNAAVLKASEDTPETALAFARLAGEAGLPRGVLNVVQGYGDEAGQPIVDDERVAV